MTNKTNLLLSALFSFGALGVRAQEATPTSVAAPSSSVTFTPAVVSQYMFRGVRLGGLSLEPAIEYDSGPLALGLWANVPLADKVAGQSDPEIDPYGSYTFTLIADQLTLQPGFTVYTYPNAYKANGFYSLTFEPNLALNYTIAGVKLTPKIYYDVVVKQVTYEFTAAYAMPLKGVGTELDFTGTIGTFKATDAIVDASPCYKNWGNYWLVGVGMPFQLTKASKLTLGVAYTKGSDNFIKQGTSAKTENTAAVGRGVVTVSYAWTF
ncbi:MAG: hypothetical protein JWM32_683 [Verrucomicrobia bacterium]|nr:hypothetical protein [Verrucomicrobiota bacterium]